MQPVNVLPAFVSQDTDLKNKDLSGALAGSNKSTDFSSLVEQHFPEENKTISRIKSSATEQNNAAIEDRNIAANDKKDVGDSQERQETGSKESLSNIDITKKNEATVTVEEVTIKAESEDSMKAHQDALTESEQFISLLYNSDQTLSQAKDPAKPEENKIIVHAGLKHKNDSDILAVEINSKNNQTQVAASDVADKDNAHIEATHKLKAFSKEELLARVQVASNSEVAFKSGEQTLKDYQLSLQSQQSTIKNQSITSEQLMNVQLANAQLKNNKVTDLAEGISQASRNQLTEKVDSGLYQLPVEPIGKGGSVTEQIFISPEVPSTTGKINEADNKTNILSKPQSVLSTELATEEIDLQSLKKVNSLLEATNVKANNADATTVQLSTANLDKLRAEGNIQTPGTLANTTNEKIVDTQIKQPLMTNAQIQELQQAQAQQKNQSINSEQQAIDSASNEYIESILPAGEKVGEASVLTTNKITDSIAMRSISDIQAQAIQTTQAKQHNDAYLEHQISEVLNHSVASDTAQIQKNNVQLQQETVSIFRKDFAEAVKDKVMITINQKLQQFDITLDPPEFGNMQVRVNLQGEQASVNFVVQNQQAKDALEQNMHKLRDMLSEQGVDVGGANVEQQSQERNTDEQGLSQSNSTDLVDGNNTEEDNVEHVLSAQLFDSSATSVDYYA
jgi:flagellar hook-length control protein FliK